MIDFGTLPPEITSARMYAGPGSGPLIAAAAAWDALAAQLESAARGYSTVITGLLDEGWSGPASAAMAGAAAPFTAWTTTTGAQAGQAARQIRGLAAAFERAFAAVVPPAVVTANRVRLANLVATNVFGQNTAQIASTEADYDAMWAADAHAMCGYAASASPATALAPFSEPPQTTNAIDTNANTELAQAMSAVPQHLHALSTAAPQGSAASAWDSALTASGNFNTLTGPTGLAEATSRTATSAGSFGTGIFRSVLQAQGAVSKALPELAPATTQAAVPDAGGVRNAVLASVGRAEPIGGLSVPPRWAAASPAPTAFAEAPWLSEAELAEASAFEAAPAAGAAGAAEAAPMAGLGPVAGSMAGAAAMGAGRATVSSILRVAPRRFAMPRPAVGG